MWNSQDPWAQQLADHLAMNAVDFGGQPFEGVFAAVRMDASGVGFLFTDPLGVAMLYRAESDELVAFSSSAALAAHAVRPDGAYPERDPLAVAWLPHLGYFVGDRTGFTGVRVVPPGCYVELNPAFGCRVAAGNPTPWASAASRGRSTSSCRRCTKTCRAQSDQPHSYLSRAVPPTSQAGGTADWSWRSCSRRASRMGSPSPHYWHRTRLITSSRRQSPSDFGFNTFLTPRCRWTRTCSSSDFELTSFRPLAW